MSSNESKSFSLLHTQIQYWIWEQAWNDLRDVQEQAIPVILDQKTDVIISASTASGKTEAAFFPILTKILGRDGGVGLTVYISPLTALINDQFSRLTALCENLHIPVWPWHGGVSASVKKRFLQNPEGVLLITPESLEAVFCNHGFQVKTIFSDLQYLVVDELHSFIGSERGKQLQSLLHLMEHSIQRKVPRIGLSATLGDMNLAAQFLRDSGTFEIIEAKGENHEVKILLKGVIQKAVVSVRDDESDSDEEDVEFAAVRSITSYLYKTLRGSNNLVFPNSRAKVELFTYQLSNLCTINQVPNEFYPHHGSLSKEIREEAELSLKSKEHSTTVICTNTLELGIDIGSVKSIVQIGSPPSVASLRQRLGRSGRRRGEAAILRSFTVEQELTGQSHMLTELRAGTFEICAMIDLLLEGWCEPPKPNGLHLSTLVQQILALISEHGGITAPDAFHILCKDGPFNAIAKGDFIELLKALVSKKLIEQDRTGLLLHGEKGEKMANHYSFYAAFSSEEEYRVVSGSRSLGTIPIQNSLQTGDFILFAGKTWRVNEIDDESKTVMVTFHKTGRPPTFNNQGGYIHTTVRQRMKELYLSSIELPFADGVAKQLVKEGRDSFARFDLGLRKIMQKGSSVYLFTWLGDAANEAVAALLRRQGLFPYINGPVIEFFGTGATADDVIACLNRLQKNPMPDIEVLLAESKNLLKEKWDWALSDSLMKKSYASLYLELSEAKMWIDNF